MQVDKSNAVAAIDPNKENQIKNAKSNIVLCFIIILSMTFTFAIGLAYGFYTGREANNKLYIIRDSATGANYFISSNGSICPRYNWDGSIYTGEPNTQDIFIDTRIQ